MRFFLSFPVFKEFYLNKTSAWFCPPIKSRKVLSEAVERHSEGLSMQWGSTTMAQRFLFTFNTAPPALPRPASCPLFSLQTPTQVSGLCFSPMHGWFAPVVHSLSQGPRFCSGRGQGWGSHCITKACVSTAQKPLAESAPDFHHMEQIQVKKKKNNRSIKK